MRETGTSKGLLSIGWHGSATNKLITQASGYRWRAFGARHASLAKQLPRSFPWKTDR